MMTRNVNLALYSSIKIGPRVDVEIIDDDNFKIEDFTIIGKSNNILFSNTPAKLAMLSKKYNYITIKNDKLYIGAATPNGKIFSFCKKNNIKNFEFTRSLPGTLGGLIKMNAGMKDISIFDNLLEVKINAKYVKKENINYSYRQTDIQGIIQEGVFDLKYGFENDKVEIFSNMRKNQPQMPSAGSCFKNPKNNFAGKLIEECGLKGYKIGNMSFSDIHSNFLVNHNNGTYEDAITLINKAKMEIKKKFDIDMELEIIIL